VHVSSRFAAENAPGLIEANITHILSVTSDDIAYPKVLDLVIKKVALEDYAHEVY
jgi:hypothetical protein